MAGNQLFPVFDVPTVRTPAASEERQYKPSVYFDFEEGDFRRDGRGNMVECSAREAYVQWCLKNCMTERLTCLSYGRDIGAEMIDAMKQETREAVQSAVERTVTETLMVNPKTEYLRGFEFTWNDSSLSCSFVLKGRDWEETRLSLTF